MKNLVKILIVIYMVFSIHELFAQTINPHYKKMLEVMYRKTVPLITVSEAAQLTAEAVFLDTRERAEYEVSHIKGARWVGYKDFSLSRIQSLPKQTLIIVYCSVGYRSEKVGERLLKAGFTNVRNLYGSIFEWVNQDQPVYKKQLEPTTEVHTYSRSWGKWLHKGTKVF
ncbi:rhodanese-like domain-containing protein [Adhaeribacter aquaticus]|uniref:rhodanese-like domain-containing protein n=1 Tax=Adhaeribacter aquaticus TaxID=299567 RepID=UPI00047B2268|nr:rhodanese-like domain-containing protein [Adhaeribacter aquaticus]